MTMTDTIFPEPGTRWRHHSGVHYNVLAISNQNTDRPKFVPTVVYENDDGEIYSRPAAEWAGSFTQVPTVEEQEQEREFIAVLRRLRMALPSVGINGWLKGVHALQHAITVLERRRVSRL